MVQFPAIDPVAIQLGPLAVHWYGLAYLVGILAVWFWLTRRAPQETPAWTRDEIGDLVFYAAVGAVLGGRVGYVLFYQAQSYAQNPLDILKVWQGGMSFHGGVLGFVLGVGWYARRHGRRFFAVSDLLVPLVPLGLGLGRIANFINQELWGAPTSLPWGVVFTHPAAGGVARHPTQLYEALLEGLVLFLLLNWLRRRKPALGTLSAAFLLGYAAARISVEFVREPDAHLGFLLGGWVTMGQVLSLPMVIAGALIWWWSQQQARRA